jgi:hypothetical protein
MTYWLTYNSMPCNLSQADNENFYFSSLVFVGRGEILSIGTSASPGCWMSVENLVE